MQRSVACCWFGVCLCWGFASWIASNAVAATTMTNVAEIEQLSKEEAATKRPVDVTGTVRYVDCTWNFLFLQQADRSIYVHDIDRTSVAPGQVVRVRGVTDRGDLKPVILARKITPTDQPSDATPPPVVPAADIAAGRFDSDFVTSEVRVCQAHTTNLRATLRCQGDSGEHFYVATREPLSLLDCHALVGTTVRVTGSVGIQLATHAYHRPHETAIIDAFKLFVPSLRFIEPTQGHAQQPAVPKLTRIGDLQQRMAHSIGKDFLLYGQVVMCMDDWLLLSEDDHSIRLDWESESDIRPGHVARVCCRIDRGENGQPIPRLTTVECVEEGQISPAAPVTVAEAAAKQPVDERIRLTGTFVKQMGDYPRRFLLSENAKHVEVSVYTDPQLLESLYLDSAGRVDVSGVFTTETESAAEFGLLVGRIDDISVLTRRLSPSALARYVLMAALALVAVGVIWVVTLRRTVHEKTVDIREVTALLRASFNASADGMLAVDNKGLAVAANDRVKEISGVEIPIGCHVDHLCNAFLKRVNDPAELESTYAQILDSPEVVSDFEVQIESPEPRFISVHTAPIRSKSAGELAVSWNDFQVSSDRIRPGSGGTAPPANRSESAYSESNSKGRRR